MYLSSKFFEKLLTKKLLISCLRPEWERNLGPEIFLSDFGQMLQPDDYIELDIDIDIGQILQPSVFENKSNQMTT